MARQVVALFTISEKCACALGESILSWSYPDPSTRGAFRRRSVGGERERHLRAGEDATPDPGRYGQPVGHYDPARSDHRQRHKAKMPRWRAALRSGPGGPGPPGSHALPGRFRRAHKANLDHACALSARHPPRLRGSKKTEMRATLWPKAHEQGTMFLCVLPGITKTTLEFRSG